MFESLPSVYAFPAQSQLFRAVRRAEAAQTDRRKENQVELDFRGAFLLQTVIGWKSVMILGIWLRLVLCVAKLFLISLLLKIIL